MAEKNKEEEEEESLHFTDFPDDIQVNILSFLSPIDISSFACTSRRYSLLCSPTSPSPSLWHPLLSRRWGAHTHLPSWNLPPSPSLYRLLHRWDPLIGFWRRIGNNPSPPLVLFEWGPSFITASRISPDPTGSGSYAVVKTPFLYLGVSSSGDPVTFLVSPDSASSLVPVSVNFLGTRHFVVEESFYDDEEEKGVVGEGLELGSSSSSPERMMFEIYQHFANRTSPGGGEKGSSRRHRRRKGKGGGRRRWEAEHFVRIADCCPTPARPLQGLWKGICENLNLEFYLVTYDDVGGVTCRRVGDSSELFSGYSPVFWTSNTTFLQSPFSVEEQVLYSSREHVGLNQGDIERGAVSRILCINSSYELVLPGLSNSVGDPRNVEGRIWEYENGTFGFGFLRNNFIVDMEHITLDGRLLDAVECCSSGSCS
ncbi:F-box protein [Iris pallida]|uniref:F-box protein n=1 Tax=Iris pallida TaxID=29817 RepID=A0AAX6ED83_IRIPA|nr:F-box protein [Iris pallida]